MRLWLTACLLSLPLPAAPELKLTSPATAKTITYLVDKKWDSKTLLYGKNGIAALTFFEVPLLRAGSSH